MKVILESDVWELRADILSWENWFFNVEFCIFYGFSQVQYKQCLFSHRN